MHMKNPPHPGRIIRQECIAKVKRIHLDLVTPKITTALSIRQRRWANSLRIGSRPHFRFTSRWCLANSAWDPMATRGFRRPRGFVPTLKVLRAPARAARCSGSLPPMPGAVTA